MSSRRVLFVLKRFFIVFSCIFLYFLVFLLFFYCFFYFFLLYFIVFYCFLLFFIVLLFYCYLSFFFSLDTKKKNIIQVGANQATMTVYLEQG